MTKNIFENIVGLAQTIAACKLANEYVEKQKQEARLRKLEEEKLNREAVESKHTNPVYMRMRNQLEAIRVENGKLNEEIRIQTQNLQKSRQAIIALMESCGDYEYAAKLRNR